MFEKKNENPLSTRHFFIRLACTFFIASLIIGISLLIGMAGYVYFEKMAWIDAYQNGAMILSGMGPVDTLKTEGGKFFAGSYALLSGILFLIMMALILAPIMHRVLHQFHFPEH